MDLLPSDVFLNEVFLIPCHGDIELLVICLMASFCKDIARIYRTSWHGIGMEKSHFVCKRLKAQRITIKEISEQLEAPLDTVKEWLYRNR